MRRCASRGRTRAGAGRRRGQTAGASNPGLAAPAVQLAPAAAAMTAAMAATSSAVRRWESTTKPASAATAGSMLSSTP